MTSLTFMFVLVPEPVWKTSMGNWSSCCPSTISAAARAIASACSAVRAPRSALVRGRGRLDPGQRVDQRRLERLAADREVLDRALGLRPPQGVLRDPDLAHGVVLDAVVVGHALERTRARCSQYCSARPCRSTSYAAASAFPNTSRSASSGPRRGPRTRRRRGRRAGALAGSRASRSAAVEGGVGVVDEVPGTVVDVEQHQVVRRLVGRRDRLGDVARPAPRPAGRRAARGRAGRCRRAATRPARARSRRRPRGVRGASASTSASVNPRPSPPTSTLLGVGVAGQRLARQRPLAASSPRCPSRRPRWRAARAVVVVAPPEHELAALGLRPRDLH